MKHGKFVMTILVNDSKVVQGSKKRLFTMFGFVASSIHVSMMLLVMLPTKSQMIFTKF
jgi:hypothetical protein